MGMLVFRKELKILPQFVIKELGGERSRKEEF